VSEQRIKSEHWTDDDGNPTGGITEGRGFTISWQNGPLGRGNDRREPNGAFVEGVIQAALDRLMFYQNTRFRCPANERAVGHLRNALRVLHIRTVDRELRGVEGTHNE